MSNTVTEKPPAVPGSAPSPLALARGALDAFLRRREASVLVVAIGLVIYFQAVTPIFLSTDNLRNIAQATAPTAIVAVGIVLLLVSGEIDVSVGMVFALSPYLMHFAIDLYHIPAIPAIVLALAVASGIGFVNGFITVRFGVPSFVTTLGMFYVLQGVLLTTSNAFPVAVPQETKGTIQSWLGAADWASLS